LLAVLELKAGWVTNPNPAETVFPMGPRDTWRAGLYNQLAWASDKLNAGYYGWKERGLTTARLQDARVLLPDGLNAGTVALEYLLAQDTTWDAWQGLVGPQGFPAVYSRFFGDPFAYAVEPLVPPTLKQPPLALPWTEGTWFFTGGPHGGWADGGAWAALDFVSPLSENGCNPAPEWVTASAPGLVVRTGDGQVVIDLDGDGFEGTGWTLHYSHLAADGRVATGAIVNAGDPLGHPSCEGGYSNATHVHFARRYNGEWISAGGSIPMDLSGWVAASTGQVYDGTLSRGDQTRWACECKEEATNGVRP
jgi:murein DD-endopeptidase MepM/ murein hydrolase activator NlpD